MKYDVSNWVMVSIWLEWTICFHCLNLFLKNLQSQRHHQNEILISHVHILPKGSNLRHKKEIWNFRSNNFYISMCLQVLPLIFEQLCDFSKQNRVLLVIQYVQKGLNKVLIRYTFTFCPKLVTYKKSDMEFQVKLFLRKFMSVYKF